LYCYRQLVTETRCLTVFITHFDQVCQLEKELGVASVSNAHMGYTKKSQSSEQVLFLYRLRSGASEGSFGLNVARLAGLPKPVLSLAAAVCLSLEATTSKL
jgi:DNA mismatch repair protein MSH3